MRPVRTALVAEPRPTSPESVLKAVMSMASVKTEVPPVVLSKPSVPWNDDGSIKGEVRKAGTCPM